MEILNVDSKVTKINETYIALISKLKSLTKAIKLRLISLCNNIMYKIISKMLSNIIKQILLELISPTQSALFQAD